MQKRIWSTLIALTLSALLIIPADAADPSHNKPHEQLSAEESALWQRIFIVRKSTEKYPSQLLGKAADIMEPFGIQIQRALQILMTNPQYWQSGRPEPTESDVLLYVNMQCGITKQQWPVKITYDDRCGKAVLQSDWLSADGIYIFTAIMNHYWMRSPRIHKQILSTSTLERSEDQNGLLTKVELKGSMTFRFDDLKKWSAYFFSHRMITERKLKEFPKLRRQLESYYAHAAVPELKIE